MSEPVKPVLDLTLSIYESMYASREVDIREQDYTQRGEAFFHVSGSGHENIAFLAPHLTADDYLHCHYRDKSLMIARGITAKQFFLSLFCKDQSHSRGRQMSAHLSDPALHVMSLVGPVGNNALQAVGAAAEIKSQRTNPIVYCGMGDGTTQEGEVLEAVAHAVRDQLPVLFVVQDNSYAISTKTPGRTFFSRPDGDAAHFYGIPIVRIDGRDAYATYEEFGRIVARMRIDRKPAIVIFQVERLNNHTNADDQRSYRSSDEIEAVRASSDPIRILEDRMVADGVDRAKIDAIKERVAERIAVEAQEAQDSPDPEPVYTAKSDLPAHLGDPSQEYRGREGGDQLVMLEAIREVLRYRLSRDNRVTLFGEDIADPKGDVFGVTKGLDTQFPGRVVNAPLAEGTIVGVSVGRALAGGRPVAFLQFADFFPIAYNQIFAELGSMYWRTDGGWTAPVIIMVTCGGYRPGLGPFHASSMESIAAHTPGVDVFMPSSAGDAAGLLNAAFESGRPTIFFYPKSCLNDRNQTTSPDVSRQLVPIGSARFVRGGESAGKRSAVTIVGWGNTIVLGNRAAAALEGAGVGVDLIDLRSLSPWDEEAVIASVKRTGNLVIVQEDSHSASMASEISATVAERVGTSVSIRRVSRPDTYVPCNYGNQLEVLPSYRRVLESAVEMLGGTVKWIKADDAEAGVFLVEAIGSSPSDESVQVLEWRVKPGDRITKGMILAELEADKAAFELSSPTEGLLKDVLVPVGDMVKVGTPLLKVAVGDAPVSKKPVTMENPGTPEIKLPANILSGGTAVPSAISSVRQIGDPDASVLSNNSGPMAGVISIGVSLGSQIVANDVVAEDLPEDWTGADIVKRTGIERRHWLAEGEDALTLAVDASRIALERAGITINDIDAIWCSTGTPVTITPSMACLVLAELARQAGTDHLAQASDIIAACSGYLYALQNAWDFAHFNPNARMLVVTTETLSERLDRTDPMTAPIFGDAATATVVAGKAFADQWVADFDRPVLSAKGEDGSALRVPVGRNEYVHMDGPKVYQEAVRHMISSLEAACKASGITTTALDLVVAHQANQRILNAVRQKTKLPAEKVFSNIAEYGNTSSSSIPIGLEAIIGGTQEGERIPVGAGTALGAVSGGQKAAPGLVASGRSWGRTPSVDPGAVIGLCAFGGGFTFGGAVLRVR